MTAAPIVVFDLDGTLVDSAPDIRAVANAVLDHQGVTPPLTIEETHGFIGRGTPHFVKCMMDARDMGNDPALYEALHVDFLSRYPDATQLTVVFDGVETALHDLRQGGARLGLCTNKPEAAARALLEARGLSDAFDLVLGGDSLAQRKPDPEPLRTAVARLGGGPALYVGDSEIDAETAQGAGIPFVFHTGGYPLGDPARIEAAARFDEFASLPALLRDLLGA
ncbi:phosphoglycolate phosphatase [Mesobaculum littorinae]|uniref:phosphoglycolate phosphatase n=1 Tax=Mesobaculum littorinae TaxID=2486419 RepID=A0A438AKW9_9RHOB|nr:phosphoglycolate phosphatase [Mesobaculum littorinae]RVV99246.1 phosphoglycolate phosphatase [Mesobaculum littorinae]